MDYNTTRIHQITIQAGNSARVFPGEIVSRLQEIPVEITILVPGLVLGQPRPDRGTDLTECLIGAMDTALINGGQFGPKGHEAVQGMWIAGT